MIFKDTIFQYYFIINYVIIIINTIGKNRFEDTHLTLGRHSVQLLDADRYGHIEE